jgi:DNA processing protein
MNRALPVTIGSVKDTPYKPPSDVSTTTLMKLLGTSRAIPALQQQRLGLGESTGFTIWLAGDESLVQRKCVAIVGTRQVSREGAARARRLGRELAEAGVVVVSGLAEGVDTHALTSAMEAGGRTIAVIGTPLEKAFPAANKRLQELIYRDHLLVSRTAPGTPTFRGSFPQRNRLMAAISDATVVIEASDTSGTLHQAAECVRLGRWLFIAKSVADDLELSWPRSFLHPAEPAKADRVRVFASMDDILEKIVSPR